MHQHTPMYPHARRILPIGLCIVVGQICRSCFPDRINIVLHVKVCQSVSLFVRARTTKNYFFDKKPLLKSSKKEDDCTNFYQNRTFYERVSPKSKFDRYTSPCFDILRNLLAPGGGTDRFQRLDISYEVGASAAMM